MLARHPSLAEHVDALLDKATSLISVKGLKDDKARGLRKPKPQQYVFELPQIAHYQPGQHFLQHEDAFPVEIAKVRA